MKTYLYLSLLIGVLLISCRDTERPFEHKEVPIAELLDGPIQLKLNPYGRSPLSAELTLESLQKTEITLTLLGDENLSQAFPTALVHKVPILGLFPDSQNQVILDIRAENGWFAQETLSIQTEALPDYLPEIQIETLQPTQMEAGFHFSNFNRPVEHKFQKHPLMFDNQGTIRWFLDLSEFEALTFPIQRLGDGNWYIFQGNKIVSFSMLGEALGEIDLTDTYRPHHDLIELPNGNLVVMVNKQSTLMPTDTGEINTWGDFIIEVERPSGNLVREWDLREVLDVSRNDLAPKAGGDWFHGNAVWHDPSDDGLIISGRNQGVVKVSQNNELQWILAPHQGWEEAGVNGDAADTKPFLLTAIDANGLAYEDSVQAGVRAHTDFDWPWGQHAASIRADGKLVLFDNGFARQFEQAPLYSRVVEYQIDESLKTVKQIRAYGADRGQALYSKVISNAMYLPQTNNLLMMPGLIREGVAPQARIVELSGPNMGVVFEASLLFKNSGGNGSNTWGNVDAVYRSGRMNLYP